MEKKKKSKGNTTEKKQRNKREIYSVDAEIIKENIENLRGGIKKNKVRYEFAERLNELLTEKKIDQEKFAEDILIANGSVSNYRKGLREPSLTILAKMADKLDVSVNYLATGNECKNYTYEYVSEMTGLSQKALNQLCRMQHNDFPLEDDIEIDFNKKQPKDNTYQEELKTLSEILEQGALFIGFLERINDYKKHYKKIQELEKKHNEANDKDVFIKLIDERNATNFAKFNATEYLYEILKYIV